MGALGSFQTLQCKLGLEVGRRGGGGSFSNSPPLGGSHKALALGRKSSCVAVQLYVRLRLGGKQTPDLPSGAGECKMETGLHCPPQPNATRCPPKNYFHRC